jgi:hypothetical protein
VNGRKANALCKADATGQAAASWARAAPGQQSPARRSQTNKTRTPDRPRSWNANLDPACMLDRA